MIKPTSLLKFEPRIYQGEVITSFFLNPLIRHYLCVFHRRSGKDYMCFYIAVTMMLFRPNTVVHYVFHLMGVAREVIMRGRTQDGNSFFDLIPKGVIKHSSARDGLIEFKNGSFLQLFSTDKTKKEGSTKVGMTPKLVVFSECALYDSADILKYYAPCFAMDKEAKSIIISTPRGKNHLFDIFTEQKNNPKYFCKKLTCLETNLISDEEIAEFKKVYGNELFNQEFLCSFTAVDQSLFYYDNAISTLKEEGSLFKDDADTCTECICFKDLGILDLTVCVLATIDEEYHIHVIDCLYGNGLSSQEWSGKLQEWEDENGIDISLIVLPPDAKQRDKALASTVFQVLSQDFHCFLLSEKIRGTLDAGIDLVIRRLKDKFITFQYNENNKHLIRSLSVYKKKKNQFGRYIGEENQTCNHFCDAFRYMCIYLERIHVRSTKASEFIKSYNASITSY